MVGLGISVPALAVKRSRLVVPVSGLELNPDPDMNSADGWTLNGWTFAGGVAISPASSPNLTRPTAETVVPGTYQYEIVINSPWTLGWRVRLGQATVRTGTGEGTFAGTVAIASVADQLIEIRSTNATAGLPVSRVSLIRIS